MAEKGGRQLQQLSLLDGDGQRLLLLEKERQRVAALRRLQIETEQFRYFEDQLRRQELANRRGDGAEPQVTLRPNPPSGVGALFSQRPACVCVPQVGIKVPEVTDGSCLSRQPIADGQQPQRAGPHGNKAPATVGQLAASLAGVHSEHRHFILFHFILF